LDARPDAHIENVYEVLMNARADMAVDLPGVTQFYCRVNGGPWTAEHLGVVANSIQGHVRGNLVREWTKVFKWPEEPAFAFRKFTRMGANHLCLEWARRSQHLWNMYVEAAFDDEFEYPDDPFEDYVEDEAFRDFMVSAECNDAARLRGIAMRAKRPTNPPK